MENINQLQESIYKGMEIFNTIEKWDIKIYNEPINIDDKKCLSLYLGIINGNNNIGNKLKQYFLYFKINTKPLKNEELLSIYNAYFKEYLSKEKINNINEFFYFLTSNNIVKKFNKMYNCDIDNILKNSNKTLVKKIK